MPERLYLTGAIQKEPGRLYRGSVEFLQIGCGITDFQPPAGRNRFSVVENPPLKIGTEKNGGLAEGVVMRKYYWAITGLDTVKDLPDDEQNNVVVVRELGFQSCQYRLGISEAVSESSLLAKGRNRVEVLEDLRRGTKIAAKHVHYLRREVRRRGLNLQVVYDPTPETAPEFRQIYAVADNYETGGTWRQLKPYKISAREIFFESQAVLIRARRLPRDMADIFNNEFLPRVDQALANPERWFNPDTLSNSAESVQKVFPSHGSHWNRVQAIRDLSATAALAS